MAQRTRQGQSGDSRLIQKRGGAKQITAEMREYRDRMLRLEERRSELERRYADQWVLLARNGTLVAGDTVDEAIAKLNAMGISRRGAVLKFVTSEPDQLIL